MQLSEAWRLLALAFAIFVGIFCLCIPFLIGYSVRIIKPTNVGFDYNEKFLTINYDKLYSSGRYWVGLGHSFKTFSTLVKNVQFHWSVTDDDSYDDDAVTGRTHDGLSVTVNMNFQYRLLADKDSLKGLYETYGYEYQPVYQSVARSVARDILSEYEAFELISHREKLSRDMRVRLNDSLYLNKFAEVTELEILNIDLPDAVEAVIMETVVAQQDVKQAAHEKNIAEIEAETSIKEAQILKKKILLEANGTVEGTLYAAEREAERILVQRTAEAEAFGSVLCYFQTLYGPAGNETEAPTFSPTLTPTLSPTMLLNLTSNGTFNSTYISNVVTGSSSDDSFSCKFTENSNFTSTDLLSYIWVQNIQSSADTATIAFDKPSMLTPMN